jgi:hypothetical protein
VTEDRITPLDLKVKSVVNLMKRLGKGSTDAFSDPQGFSKASV